MCLILWKRGSEVRGRMIKHKRKSSGDWYWSVTNNHMEDALRHAVSQEILTE